jgi:sarcosine oxidase subunit beta
MIRRPDVIVAGGGIIGTMVAWHLTREGAKVALVDPAPEPASAPGATWASAGGLRQQGRGAADRPLARLAEARWRTMEDDLSADLEIALGGHLHIAEIESELPVIEARVAADAAAGIDIRLIDRAELRDRAPQLTPKAIAAAWTPGDGQAHPGRVAKAALKAFLDEGGTAHFGEPVTLTRRGIAATGVTAGTETLEAPVTVLAAGAWSIAILADLGLRLPMRWRGLTMSLSDLARPGLLAPTVTGVGRNLSLKQLRSGQFMLGGGWLAEPTGQGVGTRIVDAHLAAQWSTGVAVLPMLARHRLVQCWSGAEAQSPDGNPFVGRTRVDGLYLAAGFSNHGFQISPAIGAAVAADIVRGEAPLLAPFAVHRLDGMPEADVARFLAEPVLKAA